MSSYAATLTVSRKSDVKDVPKPLNVDSGKEFTIGRGHKCDLAFPDVRSVSHVHCCVRVRDGVVEVKPVGTNKTLVNGNAAMNDEWHILRDGATITISTDPLIRLDLSIGSQISEKERSHLKKRRSNAIAVITSSTRLSYEYVISPETESSDMVEVHIGRAPKNHKKISSFHCSVRLERLAIPDGSVWSLTLLNPSNNRVFLDSSTDVVPPSITVPFIKPVSLNFIFPSSEHPVETLIISPAGTSRAGLTDPPIAAPSSPSALEEKRMRRELRVLDKRNSEWETSYNEETTKLMETENILLREIASLNLTLDAKKSSVQKLKNDIARIESEMKEKDVGFVNSMNGLKQDHSDRSDDMTKKVAKIVEKLGELQTKKNQLMNQIVAAR